MKRTACGLFVCASLALSAPLSAQFRESCLPGEVKVDTWSGYKRLNFVVDGCPAWIIEPTEVAPGNPWLWGMEFPFAFVERCSAPDLLKAGYYYVHVQVGNTFGCPKAIETFKKFYGILQSCGLAKKGVLLGISRGGLYAYRFAAVCPEGVSVIYGDAPVCDFKSWPGGKMNGVGSKGDWEALIRHYGFKDEAEALAYKLNPIDSLEILAKHKIALIHVVGDVDKVVPPAENTAVVEDRYLKLGGVIETIHKPDCDHHPHGLEDTTPVVEFIKKYNR